MTRPAILEDANTAINVVRQSIRGLCAADHRNDPAILARWLANKTPERFRVWTSDPANFCVLEEVEQRVQGVGLVYRSSEVLLFHVAPGFRRRGMGRRIHAALESQAVRWALSELQLESTEAARPLHESLRYQIIREARPTLDICVHGVAQSRCNRASVLHRGSRASSRPGGRPMHNRSMPCGGVIPELPIRTSGLRPTGCAER